MSVASMSRASLTDVHRAFVSALPRMDNTIRYAFRRWPKQDRQDAIAETRAAAWSAWSGLIRRGRDPVAVGVIGIANNAIRYVRSGRRVGNKSGGQGAMDINHPRAQKRCGFKVLNLDSNAERVTEGFRDSWREWAVVDNRCTPAEQAAFRLDFASWLGSLPARKRQMAELLVEGHETGVVARLLGVTPGAVSQTRLWLEASWRAYQGEGMEPDQATMPQPTSRPGHEANIAVEVSAL